MPAHTSGIGWWLLALAVVAACSGEKLERQPAGTPAPSLAGESAAATEPSAPDTPDVVTAADSLDPTLPRVIAARCEGEGCMPEDSAVACAAVVLRAAARSDAPVVASLRAGDTVASRSDLHLRAPGVVVIRRDIPAPRFVYDESAIPLDSPPSFARGDTLFLLYYQGEGYWRAWHRRRTFTVTEFWAGPAHETLGGATRRADSSNAVAYSHPAIDAWQELTHRDGRRGWWLQDSVQSVLSLYSIQKWGMSCSDR